MQTVGEEESLEIIRGSPRLARSKQLGKGGVSAAVGWIRCDASRLQAVEMGVRRCWGVFDKNFPGIDRVQHLHRAKSSLNA